MRAVRNIVNTGRTIVCTIHQPSIDIFESFDELLLLKRGGETIFNGQLGTHSKDLIAYYQVSAANWNNTTVCNTSMCQSDIGNIGFEHSVTCEVICHHMLLSLWPVCRAVMQHLLTWQDCHTGFVCTAHGLLSLHHVISFCGTS